MKNLSSHYWKLTLFFLLFLAGPAAWAQVPTWQTALGVGGTLSQVSAIANDENGNIYIAGSYSGGQVRFGSITFSNTSTGGSDIFVAKWSTASHAYVWAQQVGSGANISGIAVNGTNVYITGSFTGTVQFGAVVLVNSNPVSSGPGRAVAHDVYVAKLVDTGNSGSFVWAQRAGGAGNDFSAGIAVSGSSVYICGHFGNQRGNGPMYIPASFGNISLTNDGYVNMFVAKLTDAGGTGIFAWAQRGGGSTFEDYATAIAVNGTKIYVTGYYGSRTFSVGGISLTNNGSYSMFVIKLTDTGTAVTADWAKQGSGPNADIYAHAIALSGNNVYVSGQGNGTGNFGNIPFSNGAGTMFVTKLVDAGSNANFSWVQRAGSSSSNNQGKVLIARGANLYFGGQCEGTAVFGNSTLVGIGYYDVFVAKLIDAGNTSQFVWAQRAGGPNGDSALALALVGNELYVGGSIAALANFGNQPVGNIFGVSIGFLAYLIDPTITATTTALRPESIGLFPNPAHGRATVQLAATLGPATLTLLDALGRTLRTQAAPSPRAELGLSGLAPGIYAVRVAAGGSTATRRLVVE